VTFGKAIALTSSEVDNMSIKKIRQKTKKGVDVKGRGAKMKVAERVNVALEFSSKPKLREALKIVFEHDIPCMAVDSLTMLVPQENISLFKHLEPVCSPIQSVTDSDLSSEEVAELRKEISKHRRENLRFSHE
jgi:hypothetical protein